MDLCMKQPELDAVIVCLCSLWTYRRCRGVGGGGCQHVFTLFIEPYLWRSSLHICDCEMTYAVFPTVSNALTERCFSVNKDMQSGRWILWTMWQSAFLLVLQTKQCDAKWHLQTQAPLLSAATLKTECDVLQRKINCKNCKKKKKLKTVETGTGRICLYLQVY